jgi:antitoxin component YwqK of YwqJK toxin-antitoxin module
MKTLLLISFLTFSSHIYSQTESDIPFIGYFGGYGKDKMLKSDSTGYLFIPYVDSNIIVFISKKYTVYKIFDRQNNLILDGDIGGRVFTDYFKRFGKWTLYYPKTGKPKIIGYYYADQPTGLWKFFYPNGQLKQTYSLAQIQTDSFTLTCKVGLYEEYYENGQLKVNGFYKTALDTTTIKIYDYGIGDFKDTLIRGPVSKHFGIWKFYKENGELEKEEEDW